MTKVSIIMPTYNVEKYFRQCIESVINQTLDDIEIIPVDDGSPDNCGQIMDEYAAKDKRIKPIHKANEGYGKAINSALEVATGEYIGIVETDDYIEPDMYEKLYNQAKKFNADVCTSGFYVYNSFKSKNKENKKWKYKCENIEFFPDDKAFTIKDEPKIIMMHASVWAKIYKKEFLEKNDIKFNTTISASYQDFPFMVEAMCKANKITVVRDYFYHWRVEENQGSSTTRKDKKLMIMADQCERIKKFIKNNNLYDILKEPIYRHFTSANLAFLKIINKEYEKEYFEKIYQLFKELKDDKEFKYIYFSKAEKRFIKAVLTHNLFITKLSFGFRYYRKNFFSIHLKKNDISISLFNKKLVLIKDNV